MPISAAEEYRQAIRNAFAEHKAIFETVMPADCPNCLTATCPKCNPEPMNAVCNVEGTWLWSKLMDWCKKMGTPPSVHNELFSIATEAHNLYLKMQEPNAYHRIPGLQGIGDAADYLMRNPGDEYAKAHLGVRIDAFCKAQDVLPSSGRVDFESFRRLANSWGSRPSVSDETARDAYMECFRELTKLINIKVVTND